jgi:hypothetical protein
MRGLYRAVALGAALSVIPVGLVGAAPAVSAAVSPVSVPAANDPDPNDPYAAIDPIVRPRLVGRMTVGSTITADCGKWKPTQYSCGVDWFRMLPDGTKVKLASSPKRNNQYVIKPADRGNRITAEVVVVHPTYESHVFTRPRLVR